MLKLITVSFQKIRWSVGRKIGFCLLLLVLLSFTNSVIVFLSIQALDGSTMTERHQSDDLMDVQLFDQQLQNTIDIYNDSIYLNPYKFPVNTRYDKQTHDTLQHLVADNSELLKNPESLLSQIVRDYNQLSQVFQQANTYLQNGEADKTTVLWASSLSLRRSLKANTAQHAQDLQNQLAEAARTNDLASTVTKVSILVTGILGVLFAGLCAWLLSATIGKPLATAHRFLEAFARGDLSGQLILSNRDELGELARMLNLSVKTVAGLVESFNVGSAMELAARNLKNISSEQADYSSAQVHRISEIEQALLELTEMASSINANAASVTHAAENTFNQAQTVNQTSLEVSETIQNLQAAVAVGEQTIQVANQDFIILSKQLEETERQSLNSQKVVEIIAGIAKEIHLLSLNAAIEAAGAGTYGERFQVIAKQIKELAAHSAKSTQDISELLLLIRQSVQDTLAQSQKNHQSVSVVMETSTRAELLANTALDLSKRNQEAVTEIVSAAQKSAQQALQIKAAANRQQVASQQMQQTIGTISQVITVSAERSLEVASTSGQLDVMSRNLTLRLAELKLTTV